MPPCTGLFLLLLFESRYIKWLFDHFTGVEDANLIWSNSNRPIRRNTVNGFCKELAKDCHVIQWNKCTNHSFWQYGISKLHSLPKISKAESMALTWHKSVEAHRTYICGTNDTGMHCMESLPNKTVYYRT